ncbi:TRF2-interacting telomeric protein/Rap1 C terminal domain-containing protein [Daldinia decipiens]|uniref:TRF2-interacting telomeric protein/Rap1 C terminal domain-containing protein n=1 Tax=Daldinia decipiens TaxID=326647 RepID=UPI0020C2880F|nr:TRF2-interacting telomeric protein/Rap1 C terminal domain-containing protein [Daldinia decipiens]KAI1653300.1 TRF2-interacting telomeric protein/Rap1 C terminal domain-containing protein [Daldinia decipiens]
MSTPIVYEGAIARTNPSQNGLFSDMSFWVGHRVPQRLHFVQMIQNNGGQVVPLEKNADYLIADHVKKNACPPGSYSYKWIEESCKAGVLKEPEDYLCVPTKRSEPQPSGSAAPLKTTRTKFTAEDDLILRRWVASNERKGESVAGNVIYKQLEDKYPHHTYQSWRDRWVKILQHLPRPKESDTTPSPPPTRRTADTSTHASPKTPGSLGRRVPTGNAAATRGRVKFTEKDDEILTQHIRECRRQGKPIAGLKIFRDLANDFPHHTEQSWRTRWTKVLEPRFIMGPAEEEPEEELEEELEEEPEEEREETAKAVLGTRMEAEQPHNITTPLKSHRSRSSTHVLHTVNEVPRVVTSPTEDNVVNNGKGPQILHTEVRTTPRAPIQELEELAVDLDQSFLTKEEFLRNYQEYVKDQELQLVPWFTIKGRTFEPWDLWEAVVSQKMDPSERDWQQIAEKLGFDWVRHETIHDEIRECYEKHLADFEEIQKTFAAYEKLRKSFNGDPDDDSEDEDDEDDESNAKELLPSSPPIMPSLKRSFDAHRSSSDHTYPQPSPKRRRINRDTEIPSTPEHMNQASDLRSQADNGTTLSARRSTQRAVNKRTEENESQDTVPELPVFETQVNFEMESQCNITPSQQLHQESDAISPDLADASPTPKVGIQIANPGTPTPKRLTRNPSQEDSDDEMAEITTTSHSNYIPVKVNNAEKTKRRSLPKSYTQKSPPTSGISTSAVAPRENTQHSRLARSQPPRRLSSPKETPEDVIDRFCSLGYPRGIVLQSLRATTWRLGDAGQVMEILKRGEELPQRTHGVWTRRDDDALKLATSDEPPKDDKEKRKRIKARERLEKKHGPELIELRRKYLWEVV